MLVVETSVDFLHYIFSKYSIHDVPANNLHFLL